MKTKFKKRYVLGEGYPLYTLENKFLGLDSTPNVGGKPIKLKLPNELGYFGGHKYRLVLEKVKP